MTADQVYLLRKSFDRVEQQARVAALIFYRRLFELDPSLRPLFKTDIQEQGGKLIDMLALALILTDRPGALETELRECGARHVGYGVRDEHYATVGQAMLDMMAEVLGRDFTPATREAWAAFYHIAAEAMKRGAAAVSLGDSASQGEAPSVQPKI